MSTIKSYYVLKTTWDFSTDEDWAKFFLFVIVAAEKKIIFSLPL